jgi:predicted HicB family RNase H-like nuclease
MRKVVEFAMPPTPATPDDWVAARPETPTRPQEPTKRLTLDIPASLHRRLKVGCAERGITVAELVREMLDERFPAKP